MARAWRRRFSAGLSAEPSRSLHPCGIRLGLQTLAASFHYRRHLLSVLAQETYLSFFVYIRNMFRLSK
jgi:hypothetical protein